MKNLFARPLGSDLLRKSWPMAKVFSRLQNAVRRPGQTLKVLFTALLFLPTIALATVDPLPHLPHPPYLTTPLKPSILISEKGTNDYFIETNLGTTTIN